MKSAEYVGFVGCELDKGDRTFILGTRSSEKRKGDRSFFLGDRASEKRKGDHNSYNDRSVWYLV